MAFNRTWAVAAAGILASGATFVAGQTVGRLDGPIPATTNQGTSTMREASQPRPEGNDQVACLLPPSQLNAQREQLIPGLFDQAERVEDMSDGIRFRFAHRPNLVTELAALIEKEQVCCSFLEFRLVTAKGTGPVVLEVTGPPGTTEMLRKL